MEYLGHGFYKQICGLAEGSRLSGTLAILVMDRYERVHTYCISIPAICVRYVDDNGTVVNNTDEALRMVKIVTTNMKQSIQHRQGH